MEGKDHSCAINKTISMIMFYFMLTRMVRLLLCVAYFIIFPDSSTSTSFEILFQSSPQWSANEMVEYKGTIPTLTEFSSCHWEKLTHFAARSSAIWSYCYHGNEKKVTMSCLQLYSMGDPSSYYRNIVYALWIDEKGFKGDIKVQVESYRHRSWHHVCAIYSSISSSFSIYFDGALIQNKTFKSLPLIPGTENFKEYAFILGQEPDILRGGFSAGQAFYGSISELNLWNQSITEGKIKDMASAKVFAKGNVVSWRKENFSPHNIVIKDIQDKKYVYLNKKKSYVIFPKKLLRNEAKAGCSAHGGSIVIPDSDTEADEVRKVLVKHSNACSNENKVTECWLGVEKPGSNWIKISNQLKIENISYTNWKDDNHKAKFKGMCGRFEIDGKWKSETRESCDRFRLCTVCELLNTPVFSIKGICQKGSQFEWNYYPVINASYQIDSYEGYKRHQSISLHGNEWKNEYNGDYIAIRNVEKPIGRMEWQWLEKRCTKDPETRNLTFSQCDFATKFTCDSGDCIAISKRCDDNVDCSDGSDEEACRKVDVPQGYDKLTPPQSNSTNVHQVNTHIVIQNINQIDTEKMMLDSSLKVTMEWTDSRLVFRNLPQGGKRKLIRPEITKNLWIPIETLMYQNAIVGEVEVDPSIQISLSTNSYPLPFNIEHHREDQIYDGKNSSIQLTKIVRLKTTCKFKFRKFPFDDHECVIVLGIKDFGNKKVELKGTNRSISYIGGDTVGQFDIAYPPYILTSQNTHNDTEHTGLTIVIPLNRRPINGIIQMIIPSLVLWMCAFLTLQYDVDDLTNRSRTSVTVLLVLVTLFGSITNKSDFPKTSGFKDIDVWFVWYLINIFVIICHHTAIGRIPKQKQSNTISIKDQPICMYDREEDTLILEKNIHRKEIVNSIVNLALFLSMLSFNIFYFLMSNSL